MEPQSIPHMDNDELEPRLPFMRNEINPPQENETTFSPLENFCCLWQKANRTTPVDSSIGTTTIMIIIVVVAVSHISLRQPAARVKRCDCTHTYIQIGAARDLASVVSGIFLSRHFAVEMEESGPEAIAVGREREHG